MITASKLLSFGNAYTKKELSEIVNDPTLVKVREGIYTVDSFNSIFLFVDLIKKGKDARFHFNDYFENDLFHWDSQTTQKFTTPRIQLIAKKAVEVNLFCRLKEKVKNITQPYYYCGRLEYLVHDPETSKPVHIVYWSVDYNEATSNIAIIDLYNWKPYISGKHSSDTHYSEFRKNGKRILNYRKPTYTERLGLVTSRVGQGYYRQEILQKWQNRCAITGCNIEAILVSSHIKHWSESDDDERLDPDNGILLSPNVDALFDKHLISFSNDGQMLISSGIDDNTLLQLGISKTSKLDVNEGMVAYLEHHRARFFEIGRRLSVTVK